MRSAEYRSLRPPTESRWAGVEAEQLDAGVAAGGMHPARGQ